MCQTCDETLAAITPTSTDTDDEDDYIADDDISYERQDALANALEAPIPPPQAEHVNAMTDALGDAQLEADDSDDLPTHIEGTPSMRASLHALISSTCALALKNVTSSPQKKSNFSAIASHTAPSHLEKSPRASLKAL
jgi:hypothetical protein